MSDFLLPKCPTVLVPGDAKMNKTDVLDLSVDQVRISNEVGWFLLPLQCLLFSQASTAVFF